MGLDERGWRVAGSGDCAQQTPFAMPRPRHAARSAQQSVNLNTINTSYHHGRKTLPHWLVVLMCWKNNVEPLRLDLRDRGARADEREAAGRSLDPSALRLGIVPVHIHNGCLHGRCRPD